MFSDKTCGKHLFEILEVKESFPTFFFLVSENCPSFVRFF